MLFAKTTLNVPTSSLIAVAILTPLSGILGSLVFPLLESRHVVESIIRKIQSFKSGSSSLATTSASSWSSSSTVDSRRRRRPSNPLSILILLVTLSTSIPIWGLTRLTSRQELYALACVFGMLYGSFQAYSRTAFATVIPRSQAGRWFGLYSITDKSSSFLGPLLVSIITNETGQVSPSLSLCFLLLLPSPTQFVVFLTERLRLLVSISCAPPPKNKIRHGFYLILAFFVLSIPILSRVDLDRGMRDAELYDIALRRRQLAPPPSRLPGSSSTSLNAPGGGD